MRLLNFGRNISLQPRAVFTPTSESEVLDVLNRSRGRRIRSIGRLHSWSRIIETEDVLIDLRNLCAVDPVSERDGPAVHVGGGCQIKRLLAELGRTRGWTLPSVGFITEQTVAGAISTGTHGSGRHSLSHYVLSLRIARYDATTGKAVIDEICDGAELEAARCSLGCFGVILSVKMRCRPDYQVEETFSEFDKLEDVLAAESDFPLQQFFLAPWRWSLFAQHRREIEAPTSSFAWLYHWYRTLVFDVAMHCLILLTVRFFKLDAAVRWMFRTVIPAAVVRNWSVVAPSNSQLVMEHELFRHNEIELFVQRPQLDEALTFLRQAIEFSASKTSDPDIGFSQSIKGATEFESWQEIRGTYCHHYPVCVRRIIPDETLISMSCNDSPTGAEGFSNLASREQATEDWYAITLTNYDAKRREENFVKFTELLAISMLRLFSARPHWGKLCPLSPSQFVGLYPEMSEFARLRERCDPDHRFSNEWIDAILNHSLDQVPPAVPDSRVSP